MSTTTRTGGFPVGFRRGWSEWQKDLPALAGWAKANGFGAIDLTGGKTTPAEIKTLKDAGLRVGSVDIPDWSLLMSKDAAKRKDAVQKIAAFVKDLVEHGARAFFTVAMPEDKASPIAENFKLAVEGYGALGREIDGTGARIVFEGWPGGGSHVACNPETTRALFKETGCKALGVNYDPSHLIRMGIDHLRFLREFADRVGHVHAKDTEIFPEAIYEVGHEQGSAFEKAHGFGRHTWRYTIPGHGEARWKAIFRILEQAKFGGAVCVELEDENFNGSEQGEKDALLASRDYLKYA
ncbi:MAG: sugar phosphate isomerase/epimerase [Planctomycetota bacterium]|nr:sugar phosphate isomerase/epimerase [Planctomycetota bacterium]